MQDNLFIGMSGLSSDVSTLCVPLEHATPYRPGSRVTRRCERFRFKMNLYKLREEREMKPSTFANVVAHTLYEKRFGPCVHCC